MPRVRRKSYDDIVVQAGRIQGELDRRMRNEGGNNGWMVDATPTLEQNAYRYSRVGNTRERYLDNILTRARSRGMSIDDSFFDRGFTRNQYMGMSKSNVAT